MDNLSVRVAVVGAGGRMGREIIKAILQQDNIILGAALEKRGSSIVGADIGELIGIGQLQVIIGDSLIDVLDRFDILVDFTSPKVIQYHLSICKKYTKSMVIGTTGFNKNELKLIKKTAQFIPIVLSENFSVGVNLILKLLEKVTKIIGGYSDIEIIESHHKNKTDSPSGTALAIGKVITKTISSDLESLDAYNCQSVINGKKKKNSIKFTTIRADDIVGKHTIIFANNSERIEITHKALNRIMFANGAIKACLWLNDKHHGLYSMKDVLNFKNI